MLTLGLAGVTVRGSNSGVDYDGVAGCRNSSLGLNILLADRAVDAVGQTCLGTGRKLTFNGNLYVASGICRINSARKSSLRCFSTASVAVMPGRTALQRI